LGLLVELVVDIVVLKILLDRLDLFFFKVVEVVTFTRSGFVLSVLEVAAASSCGSDSSWLNQLAAVLFESLIKKSGI
jgi:hypothetical protein